MIFLNGLQDPQTPPETLAKHRTDYPWIDFVTHADAGQLVFQKSGEMSLISQKNICERQRFDPFGV